MVPLRILSVIGGVISLAAFVYIIITLVQTLLYGINVPGYVTTLCAVLFLGGLIELSIGVVGEYVAHIYMESKHRPIYLLKEKCINTSDEPVKDQPVKKENESKK